MKHVSSAQEEKLEAVEISKTLTSASKVKNISQALLHAKYDPPLWIAVHS